MAKQANAPTAAELAEYLKRRAMWSTLNGDVKVVVTVVDARHMFGRLELKVSPVGGSGETWANAKNVEILPKEEA